MRLLVRDARFSERIHVSAARCIFSSMTFATNQKAFTLQTGELFRASSDPFLPAFRARVSTTEYCCLLVLRLSVSVSRHKAARLQDMRVSKFRLRSLKTGRDWRVVAA